MHIWPGSPYPLGSQFDGGGTNFALFSEVAERVELCLFDDDGNETRVDLAEVDGLRLARLPAGRRTRPALRLPRARAVRPGGGQRCNPAKLLLDPYAKAIDGHIDWDEALFSYQLRRPGRRATTVDSRAVHDEVRGHQPVLRLGRRPAAAHPVPRDGHLRGARQGHDAAASRTSPRTSRGTYAGLAHPAMIEHLTPAGRHRGRADAGAPVRARHRLVDRGLRTTGATTPSASSPRTTTTPRPARRGEQVQEFKTMVRALHEAGIEVILDVVYNHTAEGNHLGPTLSLPRHRQRRLLPAGRRRPAVTTTTTTGTGNSLNVRHPHVAAADHGLAALLGDRDARRRVPLRPGLHAGPRVPRGRPAGGVLRPGPAGPGRQPGQADRRAVGRRRGRLPGRQLPGVVDRVERQVPRHCA